MKLRISKIIRAFYIIVLVPTCLLAQGTSSSLKVTTNPPGAEVILDGVSTLNGLTPISFPADLVGKYKLTIREDGYESYRSSLFLYPDRAQDININLKPKTRFKAAIRSLVIPGWGQMYAGRKARGLIFTVLAAGSAGFYFIADQDFNDKLDDYNRALARYDNATSYLAKDSLYNRLVSMKRKAYDAETGRRIAIGAVIAAWGLNLIDALFFFPDERGNAAINSLTIRPDPDTDGAQILFSHRF